MIYEDVRLGLERVRMKEGMDGGSNGGMDRKKKEKKMEEGSEEGIQRKQSFQVREHYQSIMM